MIRNVPDYVVPELEAALLREVRASRSKWVQLSGRRLQNLGGVVHAKGLIPAPLPSWLQPLLTRLAAEGGEGGLYGGQPPNHVLVNSYMPGEGIMPHEDGPAYHPVVAILSLGAPAVLRFRRKPRPAEESPPLRNPPLYPTDEPLTGGAMPAATVAAECGSNSCLAGSMGEAKRQTREPNQPHQHLQQDQQQSGVQSRPQLAPQSASTEPQPKSEAEQEDGQEQPALSRGCKSSLAAVAAAWDPGVTGCPTEHVSGLGAGGCRYSASLLLQPRSLVVFRDEAFTDCLHSIEEVKEEWLDGSVANLHMYGILPGTALPRGGERISLTVRRVARVMPSILRR
ncbi:hypothetical protein Vretimale_11510 [Volvox reticuliferus]|uniref:Alpha-ketoglutarate-dependent dioxygenase AlkB-like domain-containing protein n=1 Tax=Volvox reticuliferus TaxID=1737510 RepID=A0A8J4CW98_9CHLO|nr:hypothetical protein Vretifemale_14876 [Volvox reticuliferus]GIM07415.1 hypothetical protein Vretimale_11510 [Volvox reticuliferus]